MHGKLVSILRMLTQFLKMYITLQALIYYYTTDGSSAPDFSKVVSSDMSSIQNHI
jgi:hypothetical protein